MGLNKRLISSEAAADIPVNTENFDMVAYNGDSTNDRQITSLSFQPDLLWVKARNSTYTHRLVNSIDTTKALSSASTASETTSGLDSFLSNGWQMDYTNEMNRDGRTYIAWCWKGGGTAVSNTDGTITSQVSANTAAGFSIVSYSGASGAQTIGHGLSLAPEMIIIKTRTSSYTNDWTVYNSSLGNNSRIFLSQTSAASSTGAFNNTSPTSSVFSVGSSYLELNLSGENYIAYCFHSVDGYQKIGSYTGGSSSLINIGFRPRWVMIKATSTTSRWAIYDTVREPSGTIDQFLEANTTAAEAAAGTANYKIIFDANGFKFDHTYGQLNGSGQTYIYLAIA